MEKPENNTKKKLLLVDLSDDKPSQNKQRNNPLHGVKLADIVKELVLEYGWEGLGKKINIRCFNFDPSVNSSLKFLRKTPWAREKVEQLYIRMLKKNRRFR